MIVYSGLMLGLNLLTQYFLRGETAPALFDVIFTQTSNASILCFPILYGLLLLVFDFNRSDFSGDSRLAEAKAFFLGAGQLALLSAALFLIINIAAYFVYTWIVYGIAAVSIVSEYMYLLDVIMGCLLFLARTMFSVLLVGIGNRKLAPFGLFLPLVFSFLDWMLYSYLNIAAPWGILPMEYSGIYDTSLFGDLPPTPYLNSIIYWLAVFAVLFALAVWLRPRQRRWAGKRVWLCYAGLSALLVVICAAVNLAYNLQMQDVIEEMPAGVGFWNLFYLSTIAGDPVTAAVLPLISIFGTWALREEPLWKAGAVGAGIFLAPYLVILLCCWIADPAAKPFLYQPMGPFALLPEGAYTAVFIAHMSVISMLFAWMGRGIRGLAVGRRNAGLALVLPLLYYNVELFNGLAIIGGGVLIPVFMPLPSYIADISGTGKSLTEYLLELALLALVSVWVIWAAKRRQREACAG